MLAKFDIKKIALAGCLGLASTTLIQAQEQPDILQDVILEALEYNPEVRAKFDEFQASIHDRREAFGGYLPSVDLEGSLGRAKREHDDSRGWYARNYAEGRITQMLFDGFYVKNRVSRMEHTKRQRYFELMEEAESKTIEIIATYVDLNRYREMVRLAEINLDNHLRVQRHIQDRADSGISNQADLNQINGRVSLAESNLMTEQANLHSVTARFQRLVGRLPAKELVAIHMENFRNPDDLKEVLLEAYSKNPSLHATFEGILAAEASKREAKSAFYPKLDLIARHGTYRNNNGFDSRQGNYTYGDESIVELRVRFNLYRGGSDSAAKRAARSRVSLAEDLRDKACVDIRQNATIAHGDIINLVVKQEALKKHRDGSRNVASAYREQFDIGRRSLLDVLDSENEAFQAERAYVHGLSDLITARARVLHSMGQLMQSIGAVEQDLGLSGDDNKADHEAYSSVYCSTLDSAVMDIRRYLERGATAEVFDLSADTLFDVGSYAIKPGAMEQLQRFTHTLRTKGGTIRMINIVGHTDNTGSAAINNPLSINRARAVRDVLVKEGINAGAIKLSGMADKQPIATNNTVEGRAQNRRVTLTVVRD